MPEFIPSPDCRECIYQSLLFKNLETDDYKLINNNKSEILYKKSEIICREGEVIENFLFLKDGLIKLFKKGEERRDKIINIVKSHDFIGLVNSFSGQEHKYSISAIEDSIICFVKLDIIKDIVKRNGEFALNLIEKISDTAVNIVQTRLDLQDRQMRGRIAYIIRFFAIEIYKEDYFNLPLSRKEIGELVEMRTENVIRILSEFRKDKIISIEGKNIKVLDMKLLERICIHG